MKMDYSKAFELLNQDAEKERNKLTEKAVHDNLYNKGFRDGSVVLDKIRTEIEKETDRDDHADEYCDGYYDGMRKALAIIDKYKGESEGKDEHK
jgi:hypothetical protein